MQNLFVYGTLLYPAVWQQLVQHSYPHASAMLHHHIRLQVRGKHYPGLIPRRGSQVEGVIYFGVSAQDMQRLDRYEGNEYEHKQVTLSMEDGSSVAAITYQFKKRFRSRLNSVEWLPDLHGYSHRQRILM